MELQVTLEQKNVCYRENDTNFDRMPRSSPAPRRVSKTKNENVLLHTPHVFSVEKNCRYLT